MASNLVATVFAILLLGASAHYCSSGGRVQCMDVQAANEVSYEEGFETNGFPHCAPSGQVVYCLVDRAYQQCSGGKLPCCDDGSDPHQGSPAEVPAPTHFACSAQEADRASVQESDDQESVPEYGSSETTTQQDTDQASVQDYSTYYGDQVYVPEYGNSGTTTQHDTDQASEQEGDQVSVPEYGSSETTTQQDADQASMQEHGDQASVPYGGGLLGEPSQQAGEHLEGLLELKVAFSGTEQQGTLARCLEILSKDESGAVRVGVASHFGVDPEDVNVLRLKPAGRRLLENSDVHEFQISFTAKLMEGTKLASSSLTAELQEALDAGSSGLVVQSARITWAAPSTREGDSESTYYLILSIGGVLVVTLITSCMCVAIAKMKRSSSTNLEADATGTSVAVVSGVAVGKMAKVDDNDDLESNVPSTQDPCDTADNLSIGSDLLKQ